MKRATQQESCFPPQTSVCICQYPGSPSAVAASRAPRSAYLLTGWPWWQLLLCEGHEFRRDRKDEMGREGWSSWRCYTKFSTLIKSWRSACIEVEITGGNRLLLPVAVAFPAFCLLHAPVRSMTGLTLPSVLPVAATLCLTGTISALSLGLPIAVASCAAHTEGPNRRKHWPHLQLLALQFVPKREGQCWLAQRRWTFTREMSRHRFTELWCHTHFWDEKETPASEYSL